MVLPPTLARPPRDVLAVVLAPWQSTCWRQQDLTPSVSSCPAQGCVWELWALPGGERVRVLPGWVVRGLICPIKSVFIQHHFREGDLRDCPQPCCKNWLVKPSSCVRDAGGQIQSFIASGGEPFQCQVSLPKHCIYGSDAGPNLWGQWLLLLPYTLSTLRYKNSLPLNSEESQASAIQSGA